METHQTSNAPLLDLQEINFSMGEKKILQNLSIAVQKGTVHGIVGDNGSGKTTLFRLIFGVFSSSLPSLQQINRQQIAYLETDAYLYAYMTGYEYLQLIMQGKENKADIQAWNEILELPLQHYVQNYSTGMKKKLALLGVLLLNKEILILDEPFNGLDLKTCEIVHFIIKRLKERGKTILLSSHILDTVLQHSDQISFIEKGTILQTYSPENYDVLRELIKSKFQDQVSSKIEQLL